MPFVLVDEPTRTRADAAEAARLALDLINWARPLIASGTLVPDPSEEGARRIESTGGGILRTKRYGGSDVELQLTIERDRDLMLSCTVAAQWARPSKARLNAALDLFEAAARGAIEPGPGDEAMADVHAHALSEIHHRGAGFVRMTAATPWRNGGLKRSAGGMITSGRGDSWTAVEAAYVICVRTFAGITLAIEPLEITVSAAMFDPVETLRLLARLED